MDSRYWGGMEMEKYQNQLYRRHSSNNPGDMMWRPECYYHGSLDFLNEDPRERSGPSFSGPSHSNSRSNSSSEFWKTDREMRPEDLDEVTPIKAKTKSVAFLEMREKGLTGSMESTISKNMYQAYHGKLLNVHVNFYLFFFCVDKVLI